MLSEICFKVKNIHLGGFAKPNYPKKVIPKLEEENNIEKIEPN